MGLFDRFKKKEAPQEPAFTAVAKTIKEKPEGIPSRKYDKTVTIKVAGSTFKCHEDEDEDRQDIITGMSKYDVVKIKPYKYKRKPAYLVIDPKCGLDIGTLPANIAEEYPEREIEGYISDVDCFWPEDKDEEIWFAKVKIYILKEE